MALIQMRNIDTCNNTNEYYLGALDADKKWNDSSTEARKYFLQTSTYQSFLDPSSLILLGRTGTGKTALLRCWERNIKNKERIRTIKGRKLKINH